ncbi:PadR family transcriptional regulator [Weissella confusa]|uniref:PadR family transcriptional regulator n=1 Tax=Weissella fermenti TaxID=2987699 RepID=A0ABT6D530_9LACO|nr:MULTISPECIES: PadR family transcriptional regulator [Weissella]MBJ7688994.1 PadR family transcriptional regulator [Weissella confusa]MCW0928035.1 PadR family transcriptional regulator [Weissella sp. LMG 11983]MDF9300625.1 PadR family transcriptional regulator [Weissella sp. BK2]
MPKPRTLPKIIIGLLINKGELTGKQMLDVFNNDLSEFWKVSHSQLYPELKRMVAEKSVTINSSRQYSVTNLGKEQFDQWLNEPITFENRDLFALKIFFVRDGKSSTLVSLLRNELAVHGSHLEHLKTRYDVLFNSRSQIDENYGHYLVLTRAISRERDYLVWLDQVLLLAVNDRMLND